MNDGLYLAARPNKDLYLAARPNNPPQTRRVTLGFDWEYGAFGLFHIGAATILSSVLCLSTLLHSAPIWMSVVIGIVPCIGAICFVLCLQRSRFTVSKDIYDCAHGHDEQVTGLYDRIKRITEHSTAGFDDDLWASFIAIGQLIEQKKQLTSVKMTQGVYDKINALVAELNDMLDAREQQVIKRRELGMSLTVPGNAVQRLESGVAEELEELTIRPLLRQQIREIESAQTNRTHQ